MGIFSSIFGSRNAANETLANLIEEGAYLVDVRSKSEFDSGSVKGAVNIPLDLIPQKLNMFKGKKQIVVFCRSGMRSSNAKSILQKNGIENVINGGTWKDVAAVQKK